MDRKKSIMKILRASGKPITGNELAKNLGVSRQVIVQDVAILRAQGISILATPQGYLLLNQNKEITKKAVLAVKHQPGQTKEELTILVDNNMKVIDVIVEHPIYGELRGYLMLSSRKDVQNFVKSIEDEEAALLSSLTGGVHLHTVEFDNTENFEKAKKELARNNFLATD